MNQSYGCKFCILPEESLEKRPLAQSFDASSGPSFIAKYNFERAEKLAAIFTNTNIFKENMNVKNLRHPLIA